MMNMKKLLRRSLHTLLALIGLLLLTALLMIGKAEWEWQHRTAMAHPPLATAPAGNGPVLILLHGAGLNSHMWDAMRRHLDPRWRVIALDLPGHGARLGEPYTLEAAVAEVRQAARAVAPAPVMLVGDSLGGYTAMAAASALPQEQLRGLMMGGSTGDFDTAGLIGYFNGVLMVRTLTSFADEQTLLNKAMGKFGFTSDDAKSVVAAGASISAVPVAVRALMGEHWRPRLARIKQPVLIVNGTLDARAMAHEASFAAATPNARVYHFENCEHGVSIRRPDEFATVLDGFATQVFGPALLTSAQAR
jgi:pimeloyl-ACP methyl ester carboxylesterase